MFLRYEIRITVAQYCDMVKRELRVTSYELKASKPELKFKNESSNPRVTSSNA